MVEMGTPVELKPEKIACWLFISLATLVLLIYGKDFLIPVALAVFLSVLLHALRDALLKIPVLSGILNKKSATLLSIILIIVVNVSLAVLLTSQVEGFKDYIPVYEKNFSLMSEQLFSSLGLEQLPNSDWFSENIQFGGVLTWVGDSLSVVFSNFSLTLLFTAFLLSEDSKIPSKMAKLQKDPEQAQYVRKLCWDIARSINKYISMKTVVSALTGIASYIVLAWMGVHFAPLWALLIFFLNFIPTVGSIMGVIFPSVLSLVQFETLTPFIIVTSCLTLIQFVIGNIIEPAYFGKSLNLSSFVVLLALLFWGMVWGIVGMFLSVPMLVITSLVCQHIKGLQWISRLFSADGEFMDIDAK
ncbi:AI-2E family transporter [Alginatibacterium sediminis]|uniref:AI-2E family transporter n=1 Tax=Alginatibacterium sediminis TaxID=2164068 RepID=A0A420E6W8_9ALTE|nr:AI-2E family transporter [Alginatibacterium sediminis]RKF13697.1 AI-2E family transporter [Alginatibacterium sediminis]